MCYLEWCMYYILPKNLWLHGCEDRGCRNWKKKKQWYPRCFLRAPTGSTQENLKVGVGREKLCFYSCFLLIAHIPGFGRILASYSLIPSSIFTLPYHISNKYWLDVNAFQYVPLFSVSNPKTQITKGHRVQFPFCEHKESSCKSKLEINYPMIFSRAC